MGRRKVFIELDDVEEAIRHASDTLVFAESETTKGPVRRYLRMLHKRQDLLQIESRQPPRPVSLSSTGRLV